jgi:hypothetical protein
MTAASGVHTLSKISAHTTVAPTGCRVGQSPTADVLPPKPDKCRFVVEELGFDACVDHRAGDFVHQLEAACPAGIDVYFENVGGAVQQAVWPLLNGRPLGASGGWGCG